jgi:hypothetical protein
VPRHRLAAIASRSEQSSKAEEKDHGSWKGHPRSFCYQRGTSTSYTPQPRLGYRGGCDWMWYIVRLSRADSARFSLAKRTTGRRGYAILWWDFRSCYSDIGHRCDRGLCPAIHGYGNEGSVDRLDYPATNNRADPVFPLRQEVNCWVLGQPEVLESGR